jgi:hypothetical protein
MEYPEDLDAGVRETEALYGGIVYRIGPPARHSAGDEPSNKHISPSAFCVEFGPAKATRVNRFRRIG